MKHLAALLLFVILVNNGIAQTILNGDFENNTETYCDFNMPNYLYTIKMSNSRGFGTGSELDIQTNVCGYATPPSNNWFVSLSKSPTGTYDALSLKLSSGLTVGTTYQITYFEFATDTFSNNNIALEIGLSTDSVSFGQLIYTSLPVVNTWTERTFTFIPTNNGRFITVRIDPVGNLKGWNFVDNFRLSSVSGINNNLLESALTLFPNPSNGDFNISFPSSVQTIQIYNSIGQLIKKEQVNGLESLNVTLEVSGIYFVKYLTAESYITKKIVVNK